MAGPGGPMSAAGACLVLCCLSAISTVHGSSQDVTCPRELHSALANPSIAAIRLLPSGHWNFSREKWPGQVVVTRAVSLTGVPDEGGHPLYVDANRLTELVVVGANGSLLLSTLFLDDCLLPAMPLLCLAVAADNGNLTMRQLVLGDASCTDISHSTATDWLLKAAYWATWQTRWARVDQRSIHVVDTREVAGMPQGVRWRIANSTFRCTGNETHALPGAGVHGRERAQRGQPLASALVATLLAAAAALYYLMNRNVVTVSRNESPEVVVARSKGIVLQALIGQGTFGRVFRAQWRQGRVVAVKIIEIPCFEERVAGKVARECQHAMACSHPCIAATLAAYTVRVRTHLRRSQIMARLLREGYAHVNDLPRGQESQQAEQAQGGGTPGDSLLPGPAEQQPAAAGLPTGQPHAAAEGSPGPAGGPASPSSGGSSGGSSGEGALSVMTLLVMEYCSLGSLHRAIAAGRFFLDRRAKLPNLDWAARTALDIARGLAHLHGECRLVHRDVSTNNVLLAPDPADPRGFRAKLSDFGLATLLHDRQTHQTSQLKGTTDFMPPEIFTLGEVRFAQDVYGLGVTLFWMCTGESPYAGLAPFQVVGRKLEEVHKRARLAMPPAVPTSLQFLVWDCTHWDPCARPEAWQVANRLEALLAAGFGTAETSRASKASSA